MKESNTENQAAVPANKNNAAVIILMVVMAAIILILIFSKNSKSDSAYNIKIENLEEKVKKLEDEDVGWKNERKKSDSFTAILLKEMISINQKIIASKDRQNIIIKDHNEVPNIVNHLSVEQRYREFIGSN